MSISPSQCSLNRPQQDVNIKIHFKMETTLLLLQMWLLVLLAALAHGEKPPPSVSLLWAVALAPLAFPRLETRPLLGPCFRVLRLRSCKSHHCNAFADVALAALPEARGRLCCGCWPRAPGSLSLAAPHILSRAKT